LRKLYRSRYQKIFGGVCGGLAEYFDIDPTIIRLATAVTMFVFGSGLLIYIIAWIIIPLDPAWR
jgi:phage shock protein PspC (stress-responsive transcriptional regulator)